LTRPDAKSEAAAGAPSADEVSGVAEVNRPFIASPTCPMSRAWRWTMRLVGQVRRQYLSRLRPGYVARMRELRRGKCRCCGSCCDLTFHCPYLSPENSCKHYEKRTLTCRDFPLDALDLRLTRVPCGQYFAPVPGRDKRANSAD
jgi:hypothetical protein